MKIAGDRQLYWIKGMNFKINHKHFLLFVRWNKGKAKRKLSIETLRILEYLIKILYLSHSRTLK